MSFISDAIAPYRLAIEIGFLVALAGGATLAVHHYGNKRFAAGEAKVTALWQADRDRWQAALDKQKTEAAQTLAEQTAKTLEAERRMHEFRNAQEKTDGNNQAAVATLSRKLAAVRLRDPFATAARCGGGSGGAKGGTAAAAAAGAADPADAPGLLSERTSTDLRKLQLAADTINDAYISCRATAISDRNAITVKP